MKCITTIIVVLTMIGCSKSVSFHNWQNALESHIVHQESGDISFLRDPAGESRHKRFAILGNSSPDKSTDVSGVLVGRSNVQGQNWLVFLVATVKQRDVQDIRVAMASDDNATTRQWIWSEVNPGALAAYKNYHTSRWRRFDAVRNEPPIDAGLFPPEEDVFTFDFAGNTAWVSERNSGARWTLVLPNGNVHKQVGLAATAPKAY